MKLRPYQEESKEAIKAEWAKGNLKTLLVLPTGTGKTIVFSKLTEDLVRDGERVLILAHRGELLDQAADKMMSATGLKCAVEKAENTSIDSWYRVVVGSVQSMMRDARLEQFDLDHFDTIIVDEAHHVISDSYLKVLNYFKDAKVLGVTATPDRGDMKNLGQFFESLAYEYSLPKAIKEGYLSPIKAQTIPLKLDLSAVRQQAGDFSTRDLGNALDPYLYQIADEMAEIVMDRKTLVFLPLIATSQKFTEILNERGFRAAEVNGESKDREQILQDFADGRYNVLCNSMLLTEGYDHPAIDCVVVLRPTKIRSLYCLDTQTEVLTKEGWKTNVQAGELTASFDIKTGSIRYSPALASIRRPLDPDEYFVSYESPSMDIRVTNKHRMIYDHKRKTGWKFTTAEHLASLKSGSYIPISGNASFTGVPLSDAELKFIGWVMADGTINPLNNQITITQGAHQPWLKEIQNCIEESGFKYRMFVKKRQSQFKSTTDAVVWTISKGKPRGTSKHLSGWGRLEPYLSKDIHDNLFDMTAEQFDVMLHAIHLGDGSKHKGQSWTRRSYHISTGNKVFAERLQIMAIQRGYKANISEMSYNENPLYFVHLKKKLFANIASTYDDRPTWIKEKYAPENCWCVETEEGTLITRRNGKVAIVGNCQMVGRGTRLHPGKDHLLLLDFLWHTERHELCHPAHLIAESEDVARKMTENIEEAGGPVDLEEAELQAESDVVAEREEALAEQLREMRSRKRRLVDPLQFEMSIQAQDLSGYTPAFGWEMGPPSKEQIKALEKWGILPDAVDNAGKASKLLDRLSRRAAEGLTTPKQIRLLEQYGFKHVGSWEFEPTKRLINRIAASGWKVPRDINPSTYKPETIDKSEFDVADWGV